MAEQFSERAPCPHCSEAILASAAVCPFCRRSALLDLVALEPVADARKRYQIARRLVELGLPLPLGELVKALEAGAPVMRDATIQQALWYRAAFDEANCRARLLPVVDATATTTTTTAAKAPGRLPQRMAWITGGGAALFAAAGVWFWLGGRATARNEAPPRAPTRLVAEKLEPLADSATSQLPTPQAVARDVIPSVVLLSCREQLGTGFFAEPHLIVTNEHVTCDSDPINVQMVDGERGLAFPTTRRSKDLDIAVLHTALEGKPLPLASAGGLVTGDPAMVVGNPKGLDSTFHVGTISNPHRFINGLNYLQIDARINSGNSGGPALDARGRVVGVVSLKRRDAESLGMALPIDYLWQTNPNSLVRETLLPAPLEHPSSGFQAMLDKAQADAEATRTQAGAKENIRLVTANRWPDGSLVGVEVQLATNVPPPRLLSFAFWGRDGDRCTTNGRVVWTEIPSNDRRAAAFQRPDAASRLYLMNGTFQVCPLLSPLTRVSLMRGDGEANTIEL